MSSTGYQPDPRGLVTSCPQCGRKTRLPYSRLGSTFRCGHCKKDLPAPAIPVDIPRSTVFDRLTAECPLPVLADFWAPWCGPCKMVAPELVQVARQTAGRWLLAKVNTESVPDLAARFGINSIPTLVAFRHGREIQRQSGAMPATGILQFMNNVLAAG